MRLARACSAVVLPKPPPRPTGSPKATKVSHTNAVELMVHWYFLIMVCVEVISPMAISKLRFSWYWSGTSPPNINVARAAALGSLAPEKLVCKYSPKLAGPFRQ